ncbi:hypothetical protein ACEWY4_006197 [Coilia grayii]|uniref:Uncharacterized protein n=1 Tax=Coilia grayii TaxID=363190 RepID=A0ABD1KCV3_9TELE
MCVWRYYICVCIALTSLHTGLCQDSSAQSLKDQPREVYVDVGSELRVQCDDEPGEGMPVEWRLNGSVVQTGPLLHLNSTRLEDGGLYTCHRPSGGDAIQQIQLRPGYPPSPPDIRCWAPSYPNKALCTVSQTTETHLPTKYIITYRQWDTGTVYPCHIILTSVDFLCEMKDFETLASGPYLINITAINGLGSATKLMPFDLEDNVKPDPPVDVMVTASHRRRVLVQWRPPPSWPNPVLFPLKYKLRYYWGSSKEPVEVESYDSCVISLDSLKVGRTYHFQVSAQELMGIGQGSDWSEPVSATVSG